MPIGLAPVGLCGLFGFAGDLAMTRAAAAAGVPMILSGSSLLPMEEVAAANPNAWFQAYLTPEPTAIAALLDRVEAAGFRTLVITVDVPVLSKREREARAGYHSPIRPSARLIWDGMVRPRWTVGVLGRTIVQRGAPAFVNLDCTPGVPVFSGRMQREISKRGRLTWDHIEMIRARWRGKLVIKGVLSAEDAQQAEQAGVDGVIVSNHGGRQLDGARASLSALAEVVAVRRRMAVMIDGGFRRGTDVLKAIALGADFCFAGRPFAYAVAVAGEAGVSHALDILRGEIDRNLALLGCTAIADVDANVLRATTAAKR